MPQTTTLQITLSAEEVAFVKQRVASGEFSSESEVLSTGVQRLTEEISEQRYWEEQVLRPRLSLKTTSSAPNIPVEQVLEHLAERRRERRNAG